MLCQLRTFGAGIAVLALCFMLASLSWQFLLLGFAFAGIGWACWSCSVQIGQAVRGDRLVPRRPSFPLDSDGNPAAATTLQFQQRSRRTRGNVYAFPGVDASGTQNSL